MRRKLACQCFVEGDFKPVVKHHWWTFEHCDLGSAAPAGVYSQEKLLEEVILSQSKQKKKSGLILAPLKNPMLGELITQDDQDITSDRRRMNPDVAAHAQPSLSSSWSHSSPPPDIKKDCSPSARLSYRLS
ncbi:40S ribosomal protein S25 [Fonsecaea multimorphosa]|nr:40S ribosomal protein S25 [Fonsecaea multimorphosa]